jgi:hypothetical protein
VCAKMCVRKENKKWLEGNEFCTHAGEEEAKKAQLASSVSQESFMALPLAPMGFCPLLSTWAELPVLFQTRERKG